MAKLDQTTINKICSTNSARAIVEASLQWEARVGVKLSDRTDKYLNDLQFGMMMVEPLIIELRRCGWFSEERANPITTNDRHQTIVSVINCVGEARRLVSEADGPFIWDGSAWAGTGAAAALC